MVSTIPLEMKLQTTAEAALKTAARMDVFFVDGHVAHVPDLDWWCDHTGLVARVEFLGEDGALLWSWWPDPPYPVTYTDRIAMPDTITVEQPPC